MPLSEHVYCVAITCKMAEQVEQWICIKLCIKLEHSSAETIWMMQNAFGVDALNAAQIKVWHKHFKDGGESVESDACSGRPATSRTPESVECVQAAINRDLCLGAWKLEADLGIQKNTASKIFTWNLSWQNPFHSSCYQSRRNIVLQLLMTLFKPLPMNQISSRS